MVIFGWFFDNVRRVVWYFGFDWWTQGAKTGQDHTGEFMGFGWFGGLASRIGGYMDLNRIEFAILNFGQDGATTICFQFSLCVYRK